MFIALMMSLGISTWVFNKVMKRTGGNTQNSLIITVITAVFVFIITLVLLSIVGNIIET